MRRGFYPPPGGTRVNPANKSLFAGLILEITTSIYQKYKEYARFQVYQEYKGYKGYKGYLGISAYQGNQVCTDMDTNFLRNTDIPILIIPIITPSLVLFNTKCHFNVMC